MMKFGRYYVVNVSFRANNPVHRAIAFNFREGTRHHSSVVDLMTAGYEPSVLEAQPIDSLAYFRVVEEIEAMNARPGHLPADMPDLKKVGEVMGLALIASGADQIRNAGSKRRP